MPAAPELSLAEWIVLALVDEEPRHGFAVAALTADDGAIGRVWTVVKQVVYRALARLEELALIRVTSVEFGGRGPQRSVFETTRSGRTAVVEWVGRPVRHLRDTRSEFLVKMALLDRRSADPTGLIEAQRAAFAPMVEALRNRTAQTEGFDGVLDAWRAENAGAVLRFLDDVAARSGRRPATPRRSSAANGS